MIKGTKIKIYVTHYGHKKLLGNGKFLGSEYVWVRFPHETLLRKVFKFKVKDAIIYSSECTWETI